MFITTLDLMMPVKREKLNVFRAVSEFLNFRNESMLLRKIACMNAYN